MRQNEPNILEDIDKYKKMCDIADKLVEVSSGNRSLNLDDEDVIEFLKDKDKVEVLLEKLNNNDQSDKLLKHIKYSNKESDTKVLLNKLNTSKKQYRTIQLKKIASIAAILVISFSIFFVITESYKPSQVVESGVNLRHKEPVIILSDGKTIDLASASSDKTEASKYISSANNQIVKYNTTEDIAPKEKEDYHTIVIPSRLTYDIELADGTQITLNANSSLKFPVKFSNNERMVELSGEAYFKVTKSPKPFIVKMSNSTVTVYGTEFNVNTNKGNSIEAVLVEGIIGFTPGTYNEIMLRPNQLIKMNIGSNSCDVSFIDVNKYLGWRRGCFLYEQESISVILNDIASWYGVSFTINNKNIESIELSINLDKNMELVDLLNSLEKILKVKFINEGDNEYIIL